MFRLLYHHLKFRLKQIFRIVESNPKLAFSIYPILILLILISLSNIYLNLLYLFIVLIFHFYRKDILFLKKVFGSYYHLVVIIENVLIFISLSSININYKYDVVSLAFIAGIILFSFFTRKSIPSFIYNFHFIPDYLFELKCYLRRNTISVFIFLPIFLITSYQKDFFIFSILIVMDWIRNTFKYNENKEMLGAYFSTYSLNYKIKKYILVLNIILLPNCLFFILLNIEYYYMVPLYLLIINLYLILIITKKYANYSHKKLESYHSIMDYYGSALSSIFIFPAILQIKKCMKLSKNNINKYVRN
ncbi:hypothetical protein KRX57_00455 [Weeksellaceae bacterium TAE3-ERU29]|nr:hypothetical protein [Weeksellaceae bacterium TAE3-ERU29]